MVALKTERRVFLWHVWARALPGEAFGVKSISGPPVSVCVDEIISILEGEQSASRARAYLAAGGQILAEDDPERDEKNQIYIADIKRNPTAGTVTILVNRGDPNIVSPAFIHTDQHTVRVEEPKEKEVPGASAHLVISLTAVKGRHRACFEKMPHVSSSLVLATFDRLVERALTTNPSYAYETITKDKKGKQKITWKRYRPLLLNGKVPSEKLIDDLDEGELRGVTLTRKKIYYSGIGVSEVVKRQEEKVVITTKPVDKQVMTDFLGKLLPKAKEEGFESVSFHIDQLPGNATNNPTLNLDDEDALEQLYVRAQRLTEFDVVLEQCYPSICSEIEDKMIDLVNKGDW